MEIKEFVKKYKKELNNYWDKSFYRLPLIEQEFKLLSWIMESMRSGNRNRELICKAQLFRVYEKQEKNPNPTKGEEQR